MTSKCSACRDGTGFQYPIKAAFQPIMDLETGTPYAYEALVRGPLGEGAAAVLAQVTDANRYAFDQACRVVAIREAVAAGLLETNASLSINFLPNAVYSPLACIQLTLETAREMGLPTDRLIFEFTENEKIDTDHLRAIVAAYRKMGFRTAIDDFGAGHSGLALLADLETDTVKIDLKLVRGIDRSPRRRIIVDAILKMAARLEIQVVAEGIETEDELGTIQSLGVRYAQGYLLGRPALGRLPTTKPFASRETETAFI